MEPGEYTREYLKPSFFVRNIFFDLDVLFHQLSNHFQYKIKCPQNRYLCFPVTIHFSPRLSYVSQVVRLYEISIS